MLLQCTSLAKECVQEIAKAVRLFLDQDYYNIARQIQQQMITIK